MSEDSIYTTPEPTDDTYETLPVSAPENTARHGGGGIELTVYENLPGSGPGNTAQHGGFKKNFFKAVAACVGLLLLAGIIVLGILNLDLTKLRDQWKTSFDDFQTRHDNLTEQRDQLLTRLNNMTDQRGQWKTRLNTTDQRDQWKTMFDNMTEQRDKLETRLNTTTDQRDQLQTSLNTTIDQRDQLLSGLNTMTDQRDQLLSGLNTMTEQRDQWKTSYDELLSRHTNLTELKRVHCESHGFTFGDGVCYYYYANETKTWEDSRAFCTARQSDLMTKKSREKQDFVVRLVRSRSVWIGLTDRDEEVWKWVDGTPLTTTPYWGPGEPDGGEGEDCAVWYAYDERWYDYSCRETRYWICEIVF